MEIITTVELGEKGHAEEIIDLIKQQASQLLPEVIDNEDGSYAVKVDVPFHRHVAVTNALRTARETIIGVVDEPETVSMT